MNKLYVYTDENCKEKAAGYLNTLIDSPCSVFFIGEDYDEEKLKVEVNHVVAKGYKIICVLFGDPKFDSGINLQFATAVKLDGDSECKEKLLEELKSANEGKSKTPIIVIAVIVIIAAIAAALLLKPSKGGEAVKAENLKLDSIYLDAFIKAGADCIVVDGGISKEEMLTLEKLDLSGLGLTNLEPLLYAKNLKELNLSNNKIEDITNLAALDELECLDISGNPVKDTGVLNYLPKLKNIVK